MRFHYYRTELMCVVVGAIFLLAVGLPGIAAWASSPNADVIVEGERLVQLLDCSACHTPKVLTPKGPEPDSSRLLSGHPSDEKLPPVPVEVIGPTQWGGVFNNNLTAWAGPWGISFATNLTPDVETGIGEWTEGDFAESIRTGTHMEEGRPFLPPMPTYMNLTDKELHAIFSYLKSMKPIRNAVPSALLPPRHDAERND
jgi:hypothetical protein